MTRTDERPILLLGDVTGRSRVGVRMLTAALESRGREVLALLKRLGYELGITLVLVTHDQSVAEQAGRIIELRDGIVARDSGVKKA